MGLEGLLIELAHPQLERGEGILLVKYWLISIGLSFKM